MRNCVGASGTMTGDTGNTGTFQDESDAIWQTYLDDKRLRQFTLNEHPERQRTPITQEFMVQAIIEERKGESPPHPAREHFEEALYSSIERMVGMLSSKYSVTCIDQEYDLSQECFLRIWKKLDKFDAEKAKFTTWAWRVCTSVLNRQYRKSQKLREHITHQADEDIERKSSGCEHDSEMLAIEYSQAIRDLGEKYPKWKDFIYALMGNPDTECFPGDIVVAHAAAKAGIGRGGAMKFYHGKIQPFMEKRFRQ